MFHLFLGLFSIAASLLALVVYIFLMLIPPTLLAGLALWKKALTVPGVLCAWGLAVCVTFTGGLGAFTVLAAVFLCALLAGKLSGAAGKAVGERLHAKSGKRDAVQVLCNVAVGTVMLLLYADSRLPCFLWAYGGAMAASLADSMASELGVRSARPPRDILSFKPVEAGISGGVTALGLGASALGALIIAGLSLLLPGVTASILPDVAAAGFFAALCDSVLGSAAQAKYRCGVCGALTEKRCHCGQPGTVERGLPRIDNDAVNLLNNLIGALCALGLYFLHI